MSLECHNNNTNALAYCDPLFSDFDLSMAQTAQYHDQAFDHYDNWDSGNQTHNRQAGVSPSYDHGFQPSFGPLDGLASAAPPPLPLSPHSLTGPTPPAPATPAPPPSPPSKKSKRDRQDNEAGPRRLQDLADDEYQQLQELTDMAGDEALERLQDIKRLDARVQALEQNQTAIAEEVKELREFKRKVVQGCRSLVE